ncbi:MAG: CvpA family protein [Candidatus Eremiobacteraeota bacterium]|nr:CvpA family protein [Candidatus Eremiobacteraeota bacterium]
MTGLVWPDLVIGAIILIATLKGYKRGFISELAGVVALFAALITPFWYNGFADQTLEGYVRLGPGSAHVIAMFLVGLATYAVVIGLAWFLNRFAKLPLLGLGNALAGGAIGLLKSLVFVWFILYVALLFPLSPDLRNDLHNARLVALLTQPDGRIDGAITSVLPWFARPFVHPFFARHRV